MTGLEAVSPAPAGARQVHEVRHVHVGLPGLPRRRARRSGARQDHHRGSGDRGRSGAGRPGSHRHAVQLPGLQIVHAGLPFGRAVRPHHARLARRHRGEERAAVAESRDLRRAEVASGAGRRHEGGALLQGLVFREDLRLRAISPRSPFAFVGQHAGFDENRLFPAHRHPLRDRVPEVIPRPTRKCGWPSSRDVRSTISIRKPAST
jgi:hypothetical protein